MNKINITLLSGNLNSFLEDEEEDSENFIEINFSDIEDDFKSVENRLSIEDEFNKKLSEVQRSLENFKLPNEMVKIYCEHYRSISLKKYMWIMTCNVLLSTILIFVFKYILIFILNTISHWQSGDKLEETQRRYSTLKKKLGEKKVIAKDLQQTFENVKIRRIKLFQSFLNDVSSAIDTIYKVFRIITNGK